MLLTWLESPCILMQKRWCMNLCDTISVLTEPHLERLVMKYSTSTYHISYKR